MTKAQRKTINELLEMSSAKVREYLQTLPPSEQKIVSEELYRVKLRMDMQRLSSFSGNSQNTAR